MKMVAVPMVAVTRVMYLQASQCQGLQEPGSKDGAELRSFSGRLIVGEDFPWSHHGSVPCRHLELRLPGSTIVTERVSTVETTPSTHPPPW